MTKPLYKKPLIIFTEGGPKHYMRHVKAIVEENLVSIEDIATELAWRDMEIDKLRNDLNVFRSLTENLLTIDDPLVFLGHWNEGRFDTCRKGWPEVPESLYPNPYSAITE